MGVGREGKSPVESNAQEAWSGVERERDVREGKNRLKGGLTSVKGEEGGFALGDV